MKDAGQVFASVAEALTQPADSIRLITMSGQERMICSRVYDFVSFLVASF